MKHTHTSKASVRDAEASDTKKTVFRASREDDGDSDAFDNIVQGLVEAVRIGLMLVRVMRVLHG